ncbi:MAG: dihydroorotate dehydrogenase [Chitinispirillaceae bacterium]|nr:dihydroorotate dehydrogenase [Chitinispirillaceae bacterium]
MERVDLTVKIGEVILPTPVCVASGTFGYGTEYEELVDFSSIGAIFTKSITLKPREGNRGIRLFETPAGLLNSIGLANVGVENFLSEKLPELTRLPCPIFANVAGSTEEEYYKVIEKLEEATIVKGYEINLSCPNVKEGGIAFGTDPVKIETIISKLRKLTKKPLIVKLTPNVTDITQLARAAENGGADAITCINTCIGMVIDIDNKKPIFEMKTAGLSGPAIRPIGVAMTYKVARAVSIPIIGVGGIMSGEDALQYLLAGAVAIQIGTANFIDPGIHKKILLDLEKYCIQEKIFSITQIKELLL